jgi:zinc protease
MLSGALRNVCLCLVLLTVPARARAAMATIPVDTVVLPNGLTVIYAEDHHSQRVAVDLGFHVGSPEQRLGRSGFAHLFEHLIFQGTAHVPSATLDSLRNDGISEDGWTALDETHYWFNAPSNVLERLLWVQADRLGFLLPAVTAANLEHCKGEVQNERLLRTENAPYGLGNLRLMNLLYPAPHPYHDNVLGSTDDLDHATLDDVRAYFVEHYTPSRTALTIAGDFDRRQAERWVARYFGSIPQREAAPAPAPVEARPPAGEERSELVDRVPAPRLYFGWVTAPAPSTDESALETLRLLLSGEGGLLSKQLVHGGIASNASCSFREQRLGSLFSCQVTAAAGKSAADVERAFASVLHDLRTVGPSAEALRGAVASQNAETLRDLSLLQGRAALLSTDLFLYGDPNHWARLLEQAKQLSPETVRAVAARWLDPAHRVVVTVRPPKGSEAVAPRKEAPPVQTASATHDNWKDPEPWREKKPPLGTARPFIPPPIHRLVLANGVPIYVIENHALPVVTIELLGVGGSGVDAAGKASAPLAARLLLRGAGARDADQLAAALRLHGARLTSVASADALELTLDTLRDELPAALDLMADVVARPRLDPAELERVRSEALNDMRQLLNDGRATARIGLRRMLYGKAHPYSHVDVPGEAALRETTLDDVKTWLRRYIHPANSAILVAGDVTPDAIERFLASRLAAWAKPADALVAPAPPDLPPSPARIVLIERPGAAQANLLTGRLVPPRSAPDWESGDLATEVLDGTYTARVNANLRIRRAITYVARGHLQPRRGPSDVELFSDVPIASAPLAVAETLHEVAGVVTHPPDAAEIALARNQVKRDIAEQFATNGQAVTALRRLVLEKLPLDHYATWPQRLDSLDGKALVAAARRYLDSAMTVVIVGPAALGEALEKAGLRPIERLAADELAR